MFIHFVFVFCFLFFFSIHFSISFCFSSNLPRYRRVCLFVRTGESGPELDDGSTTLKDAPSPVLRVATCSSITCHKSLVTQSWCKCSYPLATSSVLKSLSIEPPIKANASVSSLLCLSLSLSLSLSIHLFAFVRLVYLRTWCLSHAF